MKRNLTVGISYEATYPATIWVNLLRQKVARELRRTNRCFMRIFWKFIIGSQDRRVLPLAMAMKCKTAVHFVITKLCCDGEVTIDRLCRYDNHTPNNYLLLVCIIYRWLLGIYHILDKLISFYRGRSRPVKCY